MAGLLSEKGDPGRGAGGGRWSRCSCGHAQGEVESRSKAPRRSLGSRYTCVSNLLRDKSPSTFRGWRRGHRGREIAVRGEDSGLSLGEQHMWWLGRERWAERGTEKAWVDGEGDHNRGSWNQGKSGLREGQRSARRAQEHPYLSGAPPPWASSTTLKIGKGSVAPGAEE